MDSINIFLQERRLIHTVIADLPVEAYYFHEGLHLGAILALKNLVGLGE